MVIEVMGSRVIGPFFGVSLFVWTSLITVTLVALSLGYALGGNVADRIPSPDGLYLFILLSGVLSFAIPHIKLPVLRMCLSMGLRTGSFVSATIIFGPALFLLGCVSPYLIRLSAKELRNIGRLVGIFYAVSTAGSFVGTILTGFVLIAYFGVNSIFYVIGIILTSLSVIYFLIFRRKPAFLLVFLIPLLLTTPDPIKSKQLESGTKVSRVYHKDSFYGSLKVLDFVKGKLHTRELMIDGLIQTGVDMNTGLSIYGYPYYLQFLPYALNPEGRECLMIGLGGGVVPMWYEQQGIRADVVDIDPEIVNIAQKYFGFRISGNTIVEDARYFLQKTKKEYDYILLDVFTGDTTPGHLLTIEAIRKINERLADKGILAINLMGSLKKKNFMTASVIKTLQNVFSHVEIFPVFSLADKDQYGNMVIIAYNHDFTGYDSAIYERFRSHPWVREEMETIMQGFEFPPNTPAIILTDNYNPIDFYDSWLKESIRKKIIKETDLLDMLI